VGAALALGGYSFLSALIPLFNLEAAIFAISESVSSARIPLLACVAGGGQTLGKLVWYYLGANALRWGWVRKKVETPAAQAKLTHWRQRTHDRPFFAAGLVAVSGFSGFPPFAIIAVLAGQLRMQLSIFTVVTFVSRSARFAVIFYVGEKAFEKLPVPGF
jgi:membrane protein YqaA with SNARE-associated domain